MNKTSVRPLTGEVVLNPGDVVEIETAKGLAYLQVTHLHCSYPEIVRVLPGFYKSPPDDFQLLIKLPTKFSAISPILAGLQRGELVGRVIQTMPIPQSDRPFPQFRMPIRDKSGKIVYWWLWNGDDLTYVGMDASQTDHLAFREVLSPEELISRITQY